MALDLVIDDSSQLPSSFFKKSHSLVFSHLSMSPIELDLFALLMSRLIEDDWSQFITENEKEGATVVTSVPRYHFTSSVLVDWLSIDGEKSTTKKKLFEIINQPAKRLAGKVVGTRDDANSEFSYKPLFSLIEYSSGVLTIEPNHVLMPSFLCAAQGHSQVPHVYYRRLNSEYSKRIFAMLCRFKKKGMLKPIAINDLKKYLGLVDEAGLPAKGKKTYEKVNNVVERIIKPAIAEIDAVVPELRFYDDRADTTRKGFACVYEKRSIVAIEFRFKWVEVDEKAEPEQIQPETQLELAAWTYAAISNDDLHVVTKSGLDALTACTMQLMLDGFSFDAEMMSKIKRLKESV